MRARVPQSHLLLAYTTANAWEPWCVLLLCWLETGAWGQALAAPGLRNTMAWLAGPAPGMHRWFDWVVDARRLDLGWCGLHHEVSHG